MFCGDLATKALYAVYLITHWLLCGCTKVKVIRLMIINIFTMDNRWLFLSSWRGHWLPSLLPFAWCIYNQSNLLEEEDEVEASVGPVAITCGKGRCGVGGNIKVFCLVFLISLFHLLIKYIIRISITIINADTIGLINNIFLKSQLLISFGKR